MKEEASITSFLILLVRICVGFTCGHLILFGSKTNDFWLLDPVTQHEVHFPNFPSQVNYDARIKAFLVFSRSVSGWVFVMTDRSHNLWFSVAGHGEWKHVSSTSPIVELHAFKEKIYTFNNAGLVCELSLNPEPKMTLHEAKNFPNSPTHQAFTSWNESLYVFRHMGKGYLEFYKLDFDEMKWVFHERIGKIGASSHSKLKHSAAVTHGKSKLYSWNIWNTPKLFE